MFHIPEQYRITIETLHDSPRRMASDASFGNNGAFRIPAVGNFYNHSVFFIIASDGAGWEHVSVHGERKRRFFTPSWSDMCYIKDMFWDKEDLVMQLHPRSSEYVNNHPYTLHLWRPIGIEIPTPPLDLVGIK